MATQKFLVSPMQARATTPRPAATISACVRRLKTFRICGTSSPPAICAPARMAAASPATPYAVSSPYKPEKIGLHRVEGVDAHPSVNGAASMTQRTGGLRQPLSIDSRSTARTSDIALSPRRR